MTKLTLCLDFDGVLHSYTSGWVEADFIPDPPVPGAMQFLREAIEHFEVKIYSSRSHQDGGIRAMRNWLMYWLRKELELGEANFVLNTLTKTKMITNEVGRITYEYEGFPKHKPAAFVTIDDRGLTFDGNWPSVEALKAFKPWNKK